MPVSHFKYLVVPVTAVALLTSCVDGTSTVPAPNARPQTSSVIQHATFCPCLYVTNFGNYGSSAGSSVTVYTAGATGNAKPIQTIAGPSTGLQNPIGIAVNGSGDIYVANFGSGGSGSGYVTVYPSGANGNMAPTRTIAGQNTGLGTLWGIALNPVNGDVYVANLTNSGLGTVMIYPSGANGDVEPIGTIGGASTGLDIPAGLTLDANGNIYVPNEGHDSVTVYAAGTVGNTAPARTINGIKTKQLDSPDQVALDSSSNIYIANRLGWSVTVYAARAHGNATPIESIKGKTTKLKSSNGIALDGSGNMYVASENGTQNTVTVYAKGANGDVAPINTIKGSKTGLDNPRGIVIR